MTVSQELPFIEPMTWADDGHCSNQPWLTPAFFSETKRGKHIPFVVADVISLCVGNQSTDMKPCPVLDRCLQHALDVPEIFGVWGGTTASQRRRMAQTRRKRASQAKEQAMRVRSVVGVGGIAAAPGDVVDVEESDVLTAALAAGYVVDVSDLDARDGKDAETKDATPAPQAPPSFPPQASATA